MALVVIVSMVVIASINLLGIFLVLLAIFLGGGWGVDPVVADGDPGQKTTSSSTSPSPNVGLALDRPLDSTNNNIITVLVFSSYGVGVFEPNTSGSCDCHAS